MWTLFDCAALVDLSICCDATTTAVSPNAPRPKLPRDLYTIFSAAAATGVYAYTCNGYASLSIARAAFIERPNHSERATGTAVPYRRKSLLPASARRSTSPCAALRVRASKAVGDVISRPLNVCVLSRYPDRGIGHKWLSLRYCSRGIRTAAVRA